MTESSERDHAPESEQNDGAAGEGAGKKKRRRRRRRGGGEGRAEGETGSNEARSDAEPAGERPRDDSREGDRPRKKRRRGGGGEGGRRPREGGELEDPTAAPKHRSRAQRDDWDKDVFDLNMTFADLGLREPIQRACEEAGFKHPTKIQAALVPLANTGRDVLGQAKTGTGKTAAFALPLLHQVQEGQAFQALIMAPTRELAIQIQQDFAELGRYTKIQCVAVYGGQSIATQVRKLEQGPEVIVGTPGRLLDMINRRHLSLAGVKHAVLDEVDRMFDIGFRDDIRKLLNMCPKDRQTIFVSATLSPEIEDLARRHMTNPEKLMVSAGSLTVELVKQHYLTVPPWDKKRLLAHLLTHEEPALTLVFCRMKRTVDDLVKYLDRKGIEAHAIHGDMSQGKRNQTMDQLRRGKLAVLVASDLASRGLDVEGITHVVNFDLPEDPDIYIHRIGRTARAGREGVAWSLVTPAQGGLLTEIELLINAEIPHMDYPDFEARPRPDDWRDENPNAPYHVVMTGPKKEKENRFETEAPPPKDEMSAEELKKKFPGGVVPSKLPPRVMRGKVKPRGR